MVLVSLRYRPFGVSVSDLNYNSCFGRTLMSNPKWMIFKKIVTFSEYMNFNITTYIFSHLSNLSFQKLLALSENLTDQVYQLFMLFKKRIFNFSPPTSDFFFDKLLLFQFFFTYSRAPEFEKSNITLNFYLDKGGTFGICICMYYSGF